MTPKGRQCLEERVSDGAPSLLAGVPWGLERHEVGVAVRTHHLDRDEGQRERAHGAERRLHVAPPHGGELLTYGEEPDRRHQPEAFTQALDVRGRGVDSHASTRPCADMVVLAEQLVQRAVQPGGKLGQHEGGRLATGGADQEDGVLTGGACSTRVATARGSPRRARGTRGSCARRRPVRGRSRRPRRADAAAGAPAAGELGRLRRRERGQRRSSRPQPGQEVDVVAAYRCPVRRTGRPRPT